MLGMVLMYVVVGMIVCSLVIVVHLISAQTQGYWAFEYWEVAFPEIESKISVSMLLWSMIIWPIRLWQFVTLVPTFYDVYDWRKYGPRRRRWGL